MTKTATTHSNDIAMGTFASIVLGLLLSTAVVRLLVDVAMARFDLTISPGWEATVWAGLFVGTVFAHPVGLVAHGSTWRKAGLRFLAGAVIGTALQALVVLPTAGLALSKFGVVALTAIMLPIFSALEQLQVYLDDRGVDPGALAARKVLKVMNWSDRVLIILSMAVSFGAFWLVGQSMPIVIAVLGLVLVATVFSVALIKPDSRKDDPWAGLLEDDVPTVREELATRARDISCRMLPGAIMLGGMIRVAADMILSLYPNIAGNVSAPAEVLNTIGVLGATGLAFVLFGMLAALGFGLAGLVIFGHVAHWDRPELRARCLHFVRVMCFRPFQTPKAFW